MQINCSIGFDQSRQKALGFYKKVFQVQPKFIAIRNLGDNPDFFLNEEIRNLIVEGDLEIGKDKILFSTTVEDSKFAGYRKWSLFIQDDNRAYVEKWFTDLSEGGRIEEPLKVKQGLALSGSLVDQFGISWTIGELEE